MYVTYLATRWRNLYVINSCSCSCSCMSQMASGAICMHRGSHAVLPSSRIFKEVSRVAVAPRRPLTKRLFDDRWLRLAHGATGQGFDPLGPTTAQISAFLYYPFDTHGLSPQTIKGYRSCLGQFLAAQAMQQRFRLRIYQI